jgi:hypothetical protein
MLALPRALAAAIVSGMVTYLLVEPPCEGRGWGDIIGISVAVPIAAVVFALPSAVTKTYLRNSLAGIVAVVWVGFLIYRANTSGACETIPAAWFIAGWIPPALGSLVGLIVIVLAKDLGSRFRDSG